MGASACYHLSRRGVKVLGLERFNIPHDRGSAGGFSRAIRLAYFEHPDYVPLLRRASELWNQLQQETAEKLLYITGGLYMGRPDCELVRGSIQAARENNLSHQVLSLDEVSGRFPQFTLPEDYVAFYESDTGFLIPELVISAYAEQALRAGAVLHGCETVLTWEPHPQGINVRTNRSTYQCDKVVLACGAWTNQLLSDLGIELTVTRQVAGWVWPKNPDLFGLDHFPVWCIDTGDNDRPGLHYGFPMMTHCPGLKVALHAPGRPTDPDKVERNPLEGDEDEIIPTLRRYIPDGVGPLLSLRTCLYTNSPDGHFIIDTHPSHENVLFACGFSGHGFKFASVIGEILADKAVNGRTDLPIEFLGLKRFQK